MCSSVQCIQFLKQKANNGNHNELKNSKTRVQLKTIKAKSDKNKI